MFVIVQNRKLGLCFFNMAISVLILLMLSWFLACAPQCSGFWYGWSAQTGSEHSQNPMLELKNFLGNSNMILLESSCVQQGWPGARTEWASTCWFLHLILHRSLFQEGKTKVSRWWWRSQLKSCRLTSRVLCSTKPAKCLLGLTNGLLVCDTACYCKTLLHLSWFC